MLVVASPFHSFVALNEFQGLLRALPGVRDTRVRRFYGGTLTLAIDYEDNVPLPDRLHDASGGAWAVVSSAAGRIEIATIGTSSFARHRDA